MLPDNAKPRDLLKDHQSERQHRHLLQRVNSLQSEVEVLTGKLNAAARSKADSDKEISRLKGKLDDILDSRRQDFDREKELLKRVGSIEASITSLGQQMADAPIEVVDVTASEQWHSLEQRVVQLENHPTGENGDVEGLKRQMTVLRAKFKKVEDSIQERERITKKVSPVSVSSVSGQLIGARKMEMYNNNNNDTAASATPESRGTASAINSNAANNAIPPGSCGQVDDGNNSRGKKDGDELEGKKDGNGSAGKKDRSESAGKKGGSKSPGQKDGDAVSTRRRPGENIITPRFGPLYKKRKVHRE